MKKEQVKKNPDIEWSAPSRPYKKRDTSFYQTVATLVFLLVVILFFLQEFLVIGVILAIVFVGYVLAAVPPNEVVHRITEKGVWTDDTFFSFSDLSQFWFEKHLENTVLVFYVPHRRSKILMMVVPVGIQDAIKQELQKHLTYREQPLRTLLDKISSWLTRVVPLEDKR